MAGNRSDAEIIAASLQDAAAFGEIFERHEQAIFKYAARRVGVDAASDVASDVFTTAFAKRDRFDLSYDTCLPWLYGIANNVVRGLVRRRGRASRAYDRFAIELEPVQRSPEAEAAARIEVEELRRVLNKLNKRDAEAIVLYAVENLDYKQIAVALGIKEGTVKSSINRARRKIGELVGSDRPINGWGSSNRGERP